VVARHAPEDHVADLGYQLVAGHFADVCHALSVPLAVPRPEAASTLAA
jgi:hypothetical protein